MESGLELNGTCLFLFLNLRGTELWGAGRNKGKISVKSPVDRRKSRVSGRLRNGTTERGRLVRDKTLTHRRDNRGKKKKRRKPRGQGGLINTRE